MSRILAIDTSSAYGSLALAVDRHITAEQYLHAPDGFAHLLFPAIEMLLRDAKLRLPDVDCFAVASGPGAFTGLRVGLAAAKGLAEANRKLCASISTLKVLASVGDGAARAVLLNARRGQVFAAVYDADLRPVSPEVVAELRTWVSALPKVSEFIAAPEYHLLISQIRGAARLKSPPQYLAAALALCADFDSSAIGWTDPALVDANYVRKSDAEMFWTER